MRGNRGKAWETQLCVWHDAYRRDGRAYVVKTNPSVKILSAMGRDGTFRGAFGKAGPPDFIGTVKGRTVVFDAKDTTKSRWPLSDLQRHQASDLEANHLNGGLSFVALRHQMVPYVVPWGPLGGRWLRWNQGHAKRGEASLDRAWLDEVATRMVSDGWLSVVLPTLPFGPTR